MKSGMSLIAWAVAALSVLGCAVCAEAQTPTVMQSAMNLFQPRIGTGQFATVNDFHVRFRVNRWERNGQSSFLGGPMNRNYLDPNGYYGPAGYSATSSDETGDYVDITWNFPTTQISDLNRPWFGFTFGNGQYGIPNGFRFQAVEWYWTLNGARVTQYDNTDPDVWQDWIKEWNPSNNSWELRDVIVNRETGPRTVAVTAGSLMNPAEPLTIAGLATGGALPPNPVLPPPTPVLPGGGGTVVTPWPWPDTDPNYYIYYDVADGATPGASFRNAAVLAPVPEPGTIGLLVTAGLGALGYFWRRRR